MTERQEVDSVGLKVENSQSYSSNINHSHALAWTHLALFQLPVINPPKVHSHPQKLAAHWNKQTHVIKHIWSLFAFVKSTWCIMKLPCQINTPRITLYQVNHWMAYSQCCVILRWQLWLYQWSTCFIRGNGHHVPGKMQVLVKNKILLSSSGTKFWHLASPFIEA